MLERQRSHARIPISLVPRISGPPQRRPVYRAPPPMPPGKERRLQLDAWNGSPGRDSIESHSGGGSLVAASSTQLVVSGESRHEARMVHQAQEGLLARELAALEAELGAQGARDERRHVRDARAAELCASVRERILVDELTKSEANAVASLQLSAVLRELDEQRGAISRLTMNALPEAEATVGLLVAELRQVEEAGGAEAQLKIHRLENETAEPRRRERSQENEIQQLRTALGG